MNSASDLPYPYAMGPLLEQRNTYFYPPDGGMEFLVGWVKDRRRALTVAPAEVSGIHEAARLAPSHEPGTDADPWIDSGDLLCWVAAGLGRGDSSARAWLERLHTKFEVGKRVYDRYASTAPHRPDVQGGHHHLGRYVLLAELFEAEIAASASLRHLNALLKALDTLTAMLDALDENERSRVARLVILEHEHVRAAFTGAPS